MSKASAPIDIKSPTPPTPPTPVTPKNTPRNDVSRLVTCKVHEGHVAERYGFAVPTGPWLDVTTVICMTGETKRTTKRLFEVSVTVNRALENYIEHDESAMRVRIGVSEDPHDLVQSVWPLADQWASVDHKRADAVVPSFVKWIQVLPGWNLIKFKVVPASAKTVFKGETTTAWQLFDFSDTA